MSAAQPDRSLFGPKDTFPTSGTIISRRALPAIGASEWKLSNGVVIYLKPTTMAADTVDLLAASQGGQSLIPIQEYPTASFMRELVTGLGKFGTLPREEYQQRMQTVGLNFGIEVNPDADALVGRIVSSEIELLLQHIFLLLTRASYDNTSEMNNWREAFKRQIARRSVNPQSVLTDTIVYTLANGSARVPIMTNAVVDRIDPVRAFTLWQNHFGNAAGFIFVLTGAIDTTVLAPLVERYLGGLPSSGRQKQAQDLLELHPPKGIIKRTVYAGTQPRADIRVIFSGATPPKTQRLDLAILSEILQNRLLTSLEDNFGITALPSWPFNQRYMLAVTISADTAERVNMLIGMRAVIDSLQKYGPTVEEVRTVVDQHMAGLSVILKQNQYWANQILGAALWNTPFELIGTEANLLAKITPETVQAAAKQYLDLQQYAEFVLLPAVER